MQSNLEISIKQLNENLSLINLPLISKYRVITFHGTTNGLPLTQLFNIQEIIGRTLVIKSIRFDYYVLEQPFSDIELTDGVTITNELLQRGARINRVFDDDTGMQFNFKINGSPAGIFGNLLAGVSYPADLNLDNIYFKFPEKIQTMEMTVTGGLLDSPGTGNRLPQTVKVTMECYLL